VSDEPDPTKREGSARKAWMAPTVGVDSEVCVPSPEQAAPPRSISVFDPPEERFVEKSELGRGGMGRVVEAVDRALGRSVAIKQSLATSSIDVARFEREVRITAQLQHPSVIPILDVGRDPEGHPFYIMRKIEGEPLADRVIQAKTTGDRLALISSFLGAVDAAAYAHAKRIIHRDIKPWNILLGPFGETLLIDWGIARELDDAHEDPTTLGAADTGVGLTRLGIAQGTPGFLAPEQARGEVVDARADVYSLGATLFYILANKLPYGRISATEAIEAAAAGTPPELSAIPEEVPRELIAILTKAMAAEPAERYADAGGLAADLRRFLAGQLVAAHAYSTREKLAKWVRRHRIAVTVGTIALVTVAVISAISIRQVIHDRDAAREATTLAEDRADDLLIDRARLLAATDPTSSIATLRMLRRDSPRWETARAIIRTAVPGGIERRVTRHPTYVQAVAFSPDGMRLASASTILEVHDLARRTTRQLEPTGATQLRWRDPRTLVYLRKDSAGWIDVETGAAHVFSMRDPAQLEIREHDVLVRTAKGAVIAIRPDRTETPLVEGGAVDLDVSGTRAAILMRSTVEIVSGSDRRSIGLVSTSVPNAVRLSPDGTRVATVTGWVVHEWKVETAELLHTWDRITAVDYAGDVLYGFDARAFYSLDRATPTPHLLTKHGIGTANHLIPFRQGALLYSDRGDLAYANADGVRKLAHRTLEIKRAAIDDGGAQIAVAFDRDLVVMDLDQVLPPSFAVPASTELLGLTSSHAIVRMTVQLTDPPGFTSGTSLVDLANHAQTVLDPRSLEAHFEGDLVVGQFLGERNHLQVWSGTKRVFELDRVASYLIERGQLYYVDLDGAIWRQPLTGPRVSLGRVPSTLRTTMPNGNSTVMAMILDGDEVVLSVFDARGLQFVRASGELLDLGTTGFSWRLFGRARDGAWWLVDYATAKLYRSLGGVLTAVEIDRAASAIRIFPDRVMVMSTDDTATELDLDGRVIRTISTSGGETRVLGPDLVIPTVDGVELVGPSDATRGTIRLPGQVLKVQCAGKRILALVGVGEHRRLVVWSDRVPDDPAALPAYLDTLTNARLPTGSDVLSWD
jgi:hypothetical protein